MKIKWKFEEESSDEYGNLKSYYSEPEPWKKPKERPHVFTQIIKIMFSLVICGIIIVIAFSFSGYDWNQSGFRYIKEVVIQKLNFYK